MDPKVTPQDSVAHGNEGTDKNSILVYTMLQVWELQLNIGSKLQEPCIQPNRLRVVSEQLLRLGIDLDLSLSLALALALALALSLSLALALALCK